MCQGVRPRDTFFPLSHLPQLLAGDGGARLGGDAGGVQTVLCKQLVGLAARAEHVAYADALAAAHGGPRTGADTAAAYITSGEHPVLGTPFWFLHPCRTAPAMARLAALPAWHRAHYLAAWLSWAAPMVGLAVDVSPVFL